MQRPSRWFDPEVTDGLLIKGASLISHLERVATAEDDLPPDEDE